MEGFEPPDGNATPFYIGLKLSQFGFYLTDFSPIVQLWHTANICGACATMSLRAMPTAWIVFYCINMSKILEVAGSPHLFIRISLMAFRGSYCCGDVENRTPLTLTIICLLLLWLFAKRCHLQTFHPPFEKVADCRSWLPGKS